MASKTWIPKYVRKESNYKSKQIVTADDYNAYLNMLIKQGDYNSEWLDWLTKEGVLDQLTDINGEDIQQAIIDTATEQLDQLVADSKNKTSAHLEQPVFSFIDDSPTNSALTIFKVALSESQFIGALAYYTGFVSTGTPYMDVIDLQAAQIDGFEIINHGVNKLPLTEETVVNAIANGKAGMETAGLQGADVLFAYPKGTSIETKELAKTAVDFAVGYDSGVIDTDSYDSNNLTVINLPAADIAEVDTMIEEALLNNYWCIIRMDTSEESFSQEQLKHVIDKIADAPNAVVKPVKDAQGLAQNTLNNRLAAVNDKLDALTERVSHLEVILDSVNSIRYGKKEDGLPTNPSEGDIYIMY